MVRLPNPNYRKGYNFERRVKDKLERAGFLVMDHRRSKFPDMVAISKDLVFFIECKTRKVLPKKLTKLLTTEEYRAALKIIRQTNRPFILVFRYPDNRIGYISIGGFGFMNEKHLAYVFSA